MPEKFKNPFLYFHLEFMEATNLKIFPSSVLILKQWSTSYLSIAQGHKGKREETPTSLHNHIVPRLCPTYNKNRLGLMESIRSL